MIISTKYNIGDKIYTLYNNSICSDEITKIEIKVIDEYPHIFYLLKGLGKYEFNNFNEKIVFASREEMAKYIMNGE